MAQSQEAAAPFAVGGLTRLGSGTSIECGVDPA